MQKDKQCQLVERLEVSGTGFFSWVSAGEDKSNHCHFLRVAFSRQFFEIQGFQALRFRRAGVGIFRHVDSSRSDILYHVGDSSFLPEKIKHKASDFCHL